MITLLLQYAADVNARTKEQFGGLCALHCAARFDFTAAGKELIAGGASVNQLSCTRSTALIEAAKFNSLSFVQWIISLPGIDLNAVDSSGFSAHYFAKKAGF